MLDEKKKILTILLALECLFVVFSIFHKNKTNAFEVQSTTADCGSIAFYSSWPLTGWQTGMSETCSSCVHVLRCRIHYRPPPIHRQIWLSNTAYCTMQMRVIVCMCGDSPCPAWYVCSDCFGISARYALYDECSAHTHWWVTRWLWCSVNAAPLWKQIAYAHMLGSFAFVDCLLWQESCSWRISCCTRHDNVQAKQYCGEPWYSDLTLIESTFYIQ